MERVLVDQMRFQVLFESIGGEGGRSDPSPNVVQSNMEHDTNLKVAAPTKSPVHFHCFFHLKRIPTQNQQISHKSCTGAAKTSNIVNPVSAAEANLQAMIRKAISEGRPMEEWTA